MRSGHAPLVRYLVALGAWTLAGEALLASAFVQRAVVLPFSRWQGGLVSQYLMARPLTVSVEPGCSGLEVIALCLAATLSYPVAWRKRLTGSLVSILLLLPLNVLRIAVLGDASRSAWFETLHVGVWPAILVCAAVGWVVVWIRSADLGTTVLSPTARRFATWSAVMLLAYAVAVQALTNANVLDRGAQGAAHMAAAVLAAGGADASVTQRVLRVGATQYLITPACITTPLIAFYLAALFASEIGWRARVAGTLAAVPLFAGLAVLRLLTVAIPVAVSGATLILTHGFNQILSGAAVLLWAALWWRGDRSRARSAVIAAGVAALAGAVSLVTGLAVAEGWAGLLHRLRFAVPPGLVPVPGEGDGQGALAILPVYQVALFAAAWLIAGPRGRRARWTLAAATLIASQFAFLALQGWMQAAGLPPFSALAVRGWAVAVPLALILAAGGRPAVARRETVEEASV